MMRSFIAHARRGLPFPTSVVANPELAETLRDILREEMATRWSRYVGVAALIDDTYERAMLPLLEQIP